jgi:hypothetical protein
VTTRTRTDLIGRLHPIAHGLEGGQDFVVEGVQFVRSVDGHAGDETEVVLIADGVQVDLHHVALWGVHGRTEGSPLLDVIATGQ